MPPSSLPKTVCIRPAPEWRSRLGNSLRFVNSHVRFLGSHRLTLNPCTYPYLAGGWAQLEMKLLTRCETLQRRITIHLQENLKKAGEVKGGCSENITARGASPHHRTVTDGKPRPLITVFSSPSGDGALLGVNSNQVVSAARRWISLIVSNYSWKPHNRRIWQRWWFGIWEILKFSSSFSHRLMSKLAYLMEVARNSSIGKKVSLKHHLI